MGNYLNQKVDWENPKIIGRNKEIYMVYPALNTTVGAVGSIVGSTATTKLALGIIEPSFIAIKQHLIEIVDSILPLNKFFFSIDLLISFTSF